MFEQIESSMLKFNQQQQQNRQSVMLLSVTKLNQITMNVWKAA